MATTPAAAPAPAAATTKPRWGKKLEIEAAQAILRANNLKEQEGWLHVAGKPSHDVAAMIFANGEVKIIKTDTTTEAENAMTMAFLAKGAWEPCACPKQKAKPTPTKKTSTSEQAASTVGTNPGSPSTATTTDSTAQTETARPCPPAPTPTPRKKSVWPGLMTGLLIAVLILMVFALMAKLATRPIPPTDITQPVTTTQTTPGGQASGTPPAITITPAPETVVGTMVPTVPTRPAGPTIFITKSDGELQWVIGCPPQTGSDVVCVGSVTNTGATPGNFIFRATGWAISDQNDTSEIKYEDQHTDHDIDELPPVINGVSQPIKFSIRFKTASVGVKNWRLQIHYRWRGLDENGHVDIPSVPVS